ncbi:beta-lactamase regulator AmpE [Aestuariibacter halophilus]|uniref:Beta-lactamase regulator AmpE n=1 Tax=Fluctibacter halophilus TaxID=226011 RepID=A0ABS8G7L6_9ALTE|nr:beta-lactamase regulator AmpE [Aestuariibacter halophilus]MCC2616474.1 beta-lactamase regulator AmpE [Aestuariibacter halophilus]
MILISLLLVLSIERFATQSRMWRAETYAVPYFEMWTKRGWFDGGHGVWAALVAVLLPAVLLFLLLWELDTALLSFVVSVLVMLVCIGCPSLRATYKAYLQAANRGDLEACDLYAQQLGHSDEHNYTFGQSLVWLNYQHYAAVVVWFAVFGAPGAVFYTLTRSLGEKLQETAHPASASVQSLMAILDWVPVRLTALGFLLVGHFSRALPVWLSYLPDPSVPARQVLSEVSCAAEEIEPEECDCTEEPCTLVRLAKRNVMLMLAVIAALTLSGWIA